MKVRNVTLQMLFLVTCLGWEALCPAFDMSPEQGVQGVGTQAAQPAANLTSSIFGGLWSVGNGRSTTLILRNAHQQNPALATVTLYSHDGTQAAVLATSIPAGSISRISLGSLVKTSATEQWGGLQVDISNGAQVQGQVVLQNQVSGSAVTLDLQNGLTFDNENILHSPWWLPDTGTDGRISLFNSSQQDILVTPVLRAEGQEQSGKQLSLRPHETQQLQLRDLTQHSTSSVGSLTLHYSGPAHSLQPVLWIENSSSGFAFAPAFNAGHDETAAQHSVWGFPEVSLYETNPLFPQEGKLRVYALVSNSSNVMLNGSFTAHFGSSSDSHPHRADLPLPALAPRETRLIDVSQFVDAGLLPSRLRHVALTVSYPGYPGDLAVSIFSTGPSKDIVVPWAAAALPRAMEDVAYWNLAMGVGAVPQLKNEAGTDAPVQLTLYFPTSFGVQSFVLPNATIGGNRTKRINLKASLGSSVPDRFGNRVPAGAVAGLVTLSPLTDDAPSASLVFPQATCPAQQCPQAVLPIPAAGVLGNAQIHFAGIESAGAAGAVCTSPCSISVSRNSLTNTSSTGSPSGGTFSYSSTVVSGQLTASYNTSNASANPNSANITAPSNPSAAPSAAGLAELTATYNCPAGDRDLAVFRVPTFGLSCYILASENDFLNADGSCKRLTIAGVVYSGVTQDPPGLPAGSYCTAFLGDVRLQGSGSSRNGTKVHYVSGSMPNWVFEVVADFTGADGTALIPNGSVARDRSIVPRSTTVQLQSGNFVANDTGGAIKGYRLDVFGGPGRASCAGFQNIISVGGCNPAVKTCPGPTDH